MSLGQRRAQPADVGRKAQWQHPSLCCIAEHTRRVRLLSLSPLPPACSTAYASTIDSKAPSPSSPGGLACEMPQSAVKKSHLRTGTQDHMGALDPLLKARTFAHSSRGSSQFWQNSGLWGFVHWFIHTLPICLPPTKQL